MGKKIKCKYIFADDYNPVFVNGAYGGISPQGEIVVNFYFERGALPTSHTYEVIDNKLEEASSEPADLQESFVRVVNTGIILDYKHSKIIYEWLGRHIKLLEELPNVRILKKQK